jgi:DeoR family fructose operon transcriptional repressor
MKLVKDLGVNSTPAVYVNDKKMADPMDYNLFVKMVDSSKVNKTTFCKAFGIEECIIITDESNDTLEKHAKYFIAT